MSCRLTIPDYLLCCRILGGVEREEEIKAGIAQSSGGRLHPWSARSAMLLRLLLGIIPPKVENGQAEQLFIMKRYNFSFLFSPAWIRTWPICQTAWFAQAESLCKREAPFVFVIWTAHQGICWFGTAPPKEGEEMSGWSRGMRGVKQGCPFFLLFCPTCSWCSFENSRCGSLGKPLYLARYKGSN